jgi:hypothetical protein
MAEEQRQQYDLDALRRLIPDDRGEFFVGFTPWAEDAERHVLSSRESLPEGPGRPLTRTVWNHPSERDQRVLIDVVECDSASDAMGALVDRLLNNQLASVPTGPSGLGEASFVHPEGAPPAVLFVRGNLAISVISFGRAAVQVLAWARRLNERLADRAAVERWTLPLTAQPARLKTGEQAVIRYSPMEAIGDGGCVKLFVTRATIGRRDGTLIVTAKAAGDAVIEAIVAEPGRRPYGGRLTIQIE